MSSLKIRPLIQPVALEPSGSDVSAKEAKAAGMQNCDGCQRQASTFQAGVTDIVSPLPDCGISEQENLLWLQHKEMLAEEQRKQQRVSAIMCVG